MLYDNMLPAETGSISCLMSESGVSYYEKIYFPFVNDDAGFFIGFRSGRGS